MQVLGIIEVFWGGKQVDIKPGGSVKIGGMVNSPVIYGGNVGRAQKMEQSEVNVKAIVEQGMTITDLFGSGATQEKQLQVLCDTGQSFVWADAFISGPLDITAGDNSEIDLHFVGGTPMETTAATT